MKIAFVNQPWDRAIPPVQRASVAILIFQLTRHLARSQDILVYGSRSLRDKKSLSYEGVHYHYLPITFDTRLLKITEKLSRFYNNGQPFFASYLYYLGYVFQLACHLKTQKCDIVHILNFSQYVPIIRALNPKIKIVLHMVCEWLTQLDRSIIARRLNEADLIIGCSEYTTDKIRKRFPHVANRCATVFNGVDTAVFLPKNNNKNKEIAGKRLLSVGRMSPEKGLHVLIEAMPEVIKKSPDVEWDIVGPEAALPKEFIVALSDDRRVADLSSFYQSDYSAYLRNRVNSLNLADHVKFNGAVPFSSLLTKYQTSDMLVQPSLSDALPVPVMEAMACGLPIVGSNVGGIPESVENGKQGFVVEAGDPTALAKGILDVLKDDELRKSMGAAARHRAVQLFSWVAVSKNLLGLYEGICPKKG